MLLNLWLDDVFLVPVILLLIFRVEIFELCFIGLFPLNVFLHLVFDHEDVFLNVLLLRLLLLLPQLLFLAYFIHECIGVQSLFFQLIHFCLFLLLLRLLVGFDREQIILGGLIHFRLSEFLDLLIVHLGEILPLFGYLFFLKGLLLLDLLGLHEPVASIDFSHLFDLQLFSLFHLDGVLQLVQIIPLLLRQLFLLCLLPYVGRFSLEWYESTPFVLYTFAGCWKLPERLYFVGWFVLATDSIAERLRTRYLIITVILGYFTGPMRTQIRLMSSGGLHDVIPTFLLQVLILLIHKALKNKQKYF